MFFVCQSFLLWNINGDVENGDSEKGSSLKNGSIFALA